MDGNKVSQIYDIAKQRPALANQPFMSSYDAFYYSLSTEEGISSVHDIMSKQFSLPDLDSFKGAIGFGKKKDLSTQYFQSAEFSQGDLQTEELGEGIAGPLELSIPDYARPLAVQADYIDRLANELGTTPEEYLSASPEALSAYRENKRQVPFGRVSDTSFSFVSEYSKPADGEGVMAYNAFMQKDGEKFPVASHILSVPYNGSDESFKEFGDFLSKVQATEQTYSLNKLYNDENYNTSLREISRKIGSPIPLDFTDSRFAAKEALERGQDVRPVFMQEQRESDTFTFPDGTVEELNPDPNYYIESRDPRVRWNVYSKSPEIYGGDKYTMDLSLLNTKYLSRNRENYINDLQGAILQYGGIKQSADLYRRDTGFLFGEGERKADKDEMVVLGANPLYDKNKRDLDDRLFEEFGVIMDFEGNGRLFEKNPINDFFRNLGGGFVNLGASIAYPLLSANDITNDLLFGVKTTAGSSIREAGEAFTEDIKKSTTYYTDGIIDSFSDGQIWNGINQVGNAIAQTTPQVATTIALSAATGGAAAPVTSSLTAFGFNTYVGASRAWMETMHEDVRDKFESNVERLFYSGVTGLTEGLWGLVGNVQYMRAAKMAGNAALTPAARTGANQVLKQANKGIAKRLGIAMTLEGAEEATAVAIQQLTYASMTGEDINTEKFWKNVAEAAIVGSVAGGQFASAGFAVGNIRANARSRFNRRFLESIDLEQSMEELLQQAANTKDKKLKQRLQRTAALTQEKLNQNRNNTRGDAFYQMLMVRFPDQFNEISRLNNELALLETTYNDLVSQKTGTAKDVKAAESLRAQMESMLQQKLDLEAQFESESVDLTQQEEFEFTRILTEEGLSRIKNTLEIFDGEIDTMRANNVDESKIKEMQDKRDSVKKMYDEALRTAGEVDAARKQVEALSDQALETQKQTPTQEQAGARRNLEQQESMVEEASRKLNEAVESFNEFESNISQVLGNVINDTTPADADLINQLSQTLDMEIPEGSTLGEVAKMLQKRAKDLRSEISYLDRPGSVDTSQPNWALNLASMLSQNYDLLQKMDAHVKGFEALISRKGKDEVSAPIEESIMSRARENAETIRSVFEKNYKTSLDEYLNALESRASAEVASTIADTSRRLSGRDESLKISTEELTAAKERLFNAESELAGMLDMADIVSNIGVPTDTGKAAQQKAKDRRSAVIDGRPRRGTGRRLKDILKEDGLTTEGRRAIGREVRRAFDNTFTSSNGLRRMTNKDVVETFRKLERSNVLASELLIGEQITMQEILQSIDNSSDPAMRSEMLSYLRGDLSKGDVTTMSQQDLVKLDVMRLRIDSLSKDLLSRLGMTDGAKMTPSQQQLYDTIKNNMGEYLHRSYRVYEDKNYFNQLTKEQEYRELSKEMKDKFDPVIDEMIMEEDPSLINDYATRNRKLAQIKAHFKNQVGDRAGKGLPRPDKMNTSILKGKNQGLSQSLRTLMGEETNPITVYSRTVGNLSRMIAAVEFQQSVADQLLSGDNPLATRGATDPKRTVKLFSSTDQYQFVEDIYVSEELAKAVQDFAPLDPYTGELASVSRVASRVKVGLTVYSPTTTLRNFYSGSFLSLNSGHLPFTNRKAWIEGWGGKKTKKQMSDLRKELLMEGIVRDGARSSEITEAMNNYAEQSMKNRLTSGKQSAADFAQRLYAFGDDFYKVNGYLTEKNRQLKRGKSEEEARKIAGERIRNGYPTYSFVPRNIKKVGRSVFFGSFVSFPYEAVRTTKNNAIYALEDLKQGDFRRTAGMVVANALPFALAAMTRAMVGVTKEDEENMREMLPPYARNSAFAYLPSDRASEPSVINLTSLFPSETIGVPIRAAFLSASDEDPDTSPFADAIYELVKPYVSADVTAGTILDVIKEVGEEGDADIDKISKIVTRALPGVFKNAIEIGRAADLIEEKNVYTNTETKEAVAALLGFRVMDVDLLTSYSFYTSKKESEVSEKKSQIFQQIRDGQIRTVEDLMDTFVEYRDLSRQNSKEIIDQINLLKRMQASDDQIEGKTTKGSIGKDDVKLLMDNKPMLLTEISDKSISKINLEINRLYNEDEELLQDKILDSNNMFNAFNELVRMYNKNPLGAIDEFEVKPITFEELLESLNPKKRQPVIKGVKAKFK